MTTPSAEPRASARRHLLLAVKIAVSIALLSFLFSRIDAGRLWATARQASLAWLAVALGIYLVNVLASVWRWRVLLHAQHVHIPARTLLGSFLVALFFNNFLPSNIGGDVMRIRDSAQFTGSKTLATTVVLADRVIGLIGLVLVAALGATMVAGMAGHVPSPIWPSWLWAGFLGATMVSAPALLAPDGVGRLLQPLTVLHPEWIGDRIDGFTAALARFRDRPSAIVSCFGGAVFVQATIVSFYIAVAHALHVPIAPWDLAVVVPLSFVVQMLPVSVNGFGVREATFSFYFTRVGLSMESALVVSLMATALTMLFSVAGAAVWFSRGHHH
jgi:glycosyltransferase 2 family protein